MLPDSELTLDKLSDKFSYFYNVEIQEDNIYYIVKLIDLMIFAFQNSEEAQKPNIDTTKASWNVIKKYFKIPHGDLMQELYFELKHWVEVNVYGVEEE
jgi:5'-deoxynucleotidase YfbR-like HD superfamily hydrolase